MKKLIFSIFLCAMCSTGEGMILNQVGTMTFGQADGENIWLNRIGPITYGHVGSQNVWLYDSTYGSTMTFGHVGSEPVWINNGNAWMSTYFDREEMNDSDVWVNNTSSVDEENDDDDN